MVTAIHVYRYIFTCVYITYGIILFYLCDPLIYICIHSIMKRVKTMMAPPSFWTSVLKVGWLVSVEPCLCRLRFGHVEWCQSGQRWAAVVRPEKRYQLSSRQRKRPLVHDLEVKHKGLITLCVFGLRFGRKRKGFCFGESSIIFLSDMMMEYWKKIIISKYDPKLIKF